jgi:hypothetical protein
MRRGRVLAPIARTQLKHLFFLALRRDAEDNQTPCRKHRSGLTVAG